VEVDRNSIHAFRVESSTSVLRSASSGDTGDHKKIHKIDRIKEKLVDMLREVGFKLSNGRLPWSTLEGDLQKKGYAIVNWPQGVVCDRDKGVSGLSAEDADKLYDALFIDEHRLRFIRGEDNNGSASMAIGSCSDRPLERDGSSVLMVEKRSRFRVVTADAYPRKKRRV